MGDYDAELDGLETVPGTDISPTAAAVALVGYYVGRAFLAIGLVCFLGAVVLAVAP
jgi:hypothetical protein